MEEDVNSLFLRISTLKRDTAEKNNKNWNVQVMLTSNIFCF